MLSSRVLHLRRQLRPAIKSGKTVLVVGHSTNLRALSAWIEPNLDEKALQKLEIKNTKPILYEFALGLIEL